MTTPTDPRTIPSGYQLTVRLVQSGQPAAVVLGLVSPNGVAVNQTIANNVLAKAWAALRPLIGSTVSCTGGLLRKLDAAAPDVWEMSAPPSPAGAVASGSSVPAAACLLLKWTTGFAGRSGRGRTFLPGLPGQWIEADGRTPTAVGGTAAATAITTYLGQAGPRSEGLSPAVLSFSDQVAREITGGALSPILGIQRRRMRN